MGSLVIRSHCQSFSSTEDINENTLSSLSYSFGINTTTNYCIIKLRENSYIEKACELIETEMERIKSQLEKIPELIVEHDLHQRTERLFFRHLNQLNFFLKKWEEKSLA